MVVQGSCLCGAVVFEVDLPFDRFVNCHCARCRKATGSAHAANAAVRPDAFRWTRGADDVARYDLPTARSFATAFYRACGSPLPHATRSGREVILPCGSLDAHPKERPTAQVHWGSRAPLVDDAVPCPLRISRPPRRWQWGVKRSREGEAGRRGRLAVPSCSRR